MPVEGDGSLVLIKDGVPDPSDGFLCDFELDRGGGFEDDLVSIGLLCEGFDSFGVDASDREPVEDLGDIRVFVGRCDD